MPRNLYQLTQDYFKDRRTVMLINNRKIEKNITKGFHRGHVVGQDFGLYNITPFLTYNSLTILKRSHLQTT